MSGAPTVLVGFFFGIIFLVGLKLVDPVSICCAVNPAIVEGPVSSKRLATSAAGIFVVERFAAVALGAAAPPPDAFGGLPLRGF
jgi:hypothetical protein